MKISVWNSLKAMAHKAFSDASPHLYGVGNTQPIQREILCRKLAGPPPFRGLENGLPRALSSAARFSGSDPGSARSSLTP